MTGFMLTLYRWSGHHGDDSLSGAAMAASSAVLFRRLVQLGMAGWQPASRAPVVVLPGDGGASGSCCCGGGVASVVGGFGRG
jgi:hypothetical protein